MHISRRTAAVVAGLLLSDRVAAIDIDATSEDSLKSAASTIAASVVSLYNGNAPGNIPGLFPDPYYWWEAGWAWNSLVTYQALTGDDQYQDIVSQALLFQVGPDLNYMPPNQSKSLGNDDQSYWALAALTAHETGFALPGDAEVDSWLQLAIDVFDTQVTRWDNDTCGGGLRWQIYSFNNGYDYKNSFANGNFAELAARLYVSTKNETYANWANEAINWLGQVGLLAGDEKVFDGVSTTDNCKDVNHLQWTAASASVISAFAYLTYGLGNGTETNAVTPLDQLKVFTKDNLLYEVACQPNGNCNVDQIAFRGILARALATVRDFKSIAIDSADVDVEKVLQASAVAVGESCTGGRNGTTCGEDWTKGRYDGQKGLSEDLSALNVILANLPQKISAVGSAANSTTGGSNATDNSSSTGSATPSTSIAAPPQNSSATEQQAGNGGVSNAASTFGLLSAVAFAVAFFL